MTLGRSFMRASTVGGDMPVPSTHEELDAAIDNEETLERYQCMAKELVINLKDLKYILGVGFGLLISLSVWNILEDRRRQEKVNDFILQRQAVVDKTVTDLQRDLAMLQVKLTAVEDKLKAQK